MLEGRVTLISYKKVMASRNQPRYTSESPYEVHYLYDGVGYKERMYMLRTGGKTYFDFSKTKHQELGLVEIQEIKEVAG